MEGGDDLGNIQLGASERLAEGGPDGFVPPRLPHKTFSFGSPGLPVFSTRDMVNRYL